MKLSIIKLPCLFLFMLLTACGGGGSGNNGGGSGSGGNKITLTPSLTPDPLQSLQGGVVTITADKILVSDIKVAATENKGLLTFTSAGCTIVTGKKSCSFTVNAAEVNPGQTKTSTVFFKTNNHSASISSLGFSVQGSQSRTLILTPALNPNPITSQGSGVITITANQSPLTNTLVTAEKANLLSFSQPTCTINVGKKQCSLSVKAAQINSPTAQSGTVSFKTNNPNASISALTFSIQNNAPVSQGNIDIHLVADSIGVGKNSSPEIYNEGYKGYALNYMSKLAMQAGSGFSRNGDGSAANPVTDLYYHNHKIIYTGFQRMDTGNGATTTSLLPDVMYSSHNYYATAKSGITILQTTKNVQNSYQYQELQMGTAAGPKPIDYTNDYVISMVQLGTNDITGVDGAICDYIPGSTLPTVQSQTDIAQRVDKLVNGNYQTDINSLVGSLYNYYKNVKKVSPKQLAFMIFEIPSRGPTDGKDPYNICTNYFNQTLVTQVKAANAAYQTGEQVKFYVIDQSKVSATSPGGGGHVHPGDVGHKAMACNLINGTKVAQVQVSSITVCPPPSGGIYQSGLMKVLPDLGL
ncbi:hypothetical protein [uncultured Shewanella sp.]|uniref:hypothetical protein n=1 Tax=uncultured Shewanella sp. TaxID=173975 RepID=UPI002617013F|nr:hypothetical protein [uncultured Shewanella sp.]